MNDNLEIVIYETVYLGNSETENAIDLRWLNKTKSKTNQIGVKQIFPKWNIENLAIVNKSEKQQLCFDAITEFN